MSGRPKAPVKAPTKGGSGVKAKPAAKTQPAKAQPSKSQPAAKKGGKTEASAGPSKEAKGQPEVTKQEEKAKQPAAHTRLTVKDLKTVLAEDNNNTIRDAGKAVLCVDNESNTACSYLTYASNSTLVDGMNPQKMDTEQIRKGVLSCIRFGKIYVVDMKEVAEGMFDELVKRFDIALKGTFSSVLDRSILKDEKFLSLKTDEDGEMFDDFYFTDQEYSRFYLVILSTNRQHTEAFKDKFTLFTVDELQK